MRNVENRILQWIPLFITMILAIVTLLIYSVTNEEKTTLVYLQVIATAFVPAIFPIISVVTKKDFPIFINVLIAIHIFLASDLGSALSFYGRFGAWDLIMHGYFGFVFSVIIYTLLLKWNGTQLNRFGFLALIFMSTLGAAAVWEIWEYSCDTFLGSDAQRVQEALSNGLSPIADTMTDIVVAIAGVAVFYAGLYIDKLCKYMVSKKIYAKVIKKGKQ